MQVYIAQSTLLFSPYLAGRKYLIMPFLRVLFLRKWMQQTNLQFKISSPIFIWLPAHRSKLCTRLHMKSTQFGSKFLVSGNNLHDKRTRTLGAIIFHLQAYRYTIVISMASDQTSYIPQFHHFIPLMSEHPMRGTQGRIIVNDFVIDKMIWQVLFRHFFYLRSATSKWLFVWSLLVLSMMIKYIRYQSL